MNNNLHFKPEENYWEMSYHWNWCYFIFPRIFKIKDEFDKIQESLLKFTWKKWIFKKPDWTIIFNWEQAVWENTFYIDSYTSYILNHNIEWVVELMDKFDQGALRKLVFELVSGDGNGNIENTPKAQIIPIFKT